VLKSGLVRADRERLEAVNRFGEQARKSMCGGLGLWLLSAEGMGTMAIQRQDRQRQADDLALAGAVHGRRRRRAAPRRDAPWRQAAADAGGGRARGRVDARRATGRDDALDCRAMAKAAGVSHRSVQRIWAAHGLKPHRVKTFKLSNDPKFAAKVQDVVGLYVDPPEHALVLSVDEKSQSRRSTAPSRDCR